VSSRKPGGKDVVIDSMSKPKNDGKYDDEMKRHDVTILPLKSQD
jgi:hypothetical protein